MLQREAESNRTVYNQLLTREKELRVVANSRTNNVRVVDRAQVPRRAVSRRTIAATGSTPSPSASRWASAMAFGIDYLDDTVKTPDDITRRLKLQVPRPGADRRAASVIR